MTLPPKPCTHISSTPGNSTVHMPSSQPLYLQSSDTENGMRFIGTGNGALEVGDHIRRHSEREQIHEEGFGSHRAALILRPKRK